MVPWGEPWGPWRTLGNPGVTPVGELKRDCDDYGGPFEGEEPYWNALLVVGEDSSGSHMCWEDEVARAMIDD